MDSELEKLRTALRQMPVPPPSPGFVDRALARAESAGTSARLSQGWAAKALGEVRRLASRWETWVGAGLGGAVAATMALMLVRPDAETVSPPVAIALALNESRDIAVVIDSERDLQDATISIVLSGGVELAGFENPQELRWQATLEHGQNLLSLPVIARSPGAGRLVAVIEHGGRTKRVAVDLTVRGSRSGAGDGASSPLGTA